MLRAESELKLWGNSYENYSCSCSTNNFGYAEHPFDQWFDKKDKNSN